MATSTTTYRVEGMHCGSCKDKVERALRGVPGVRSAAVSLEHESAEVETNGEATFDAMRNAVSRAGDYTLERTDEGSHEEHAQGGAASGGEPEESLYPLFLIVGYIAGVTVLIAAATGGWAAEPMMRHFMAGFFLVFSFFKLLDLRGFVGAYVMYDLVAARWTGWAWMYPFVEAALGVAYLVNAAPVIVNSVTLVVMLVGAAGVLRALLDKRQIRCACLGTALNLPMTKVTLVEDLAMAGMAGGMLAVIAASGG